MDIFARVLAAIGIAGTGVSFFLTRYLARLDRNEDQRVKAYRDVLDIVAALRAAMATLAAEYDYNQQQHHESYEPTNQLQVKAMDIIERSRVDVGDSFADAATSVIACWAGETGDLWDRRYDAPAPVPSLKEREAALLDAVPRRYRKRVYPGNFKS